MNKEEYQEKIANIVCGKSEKITCEECYILADGNVCKNFKECRISEKTEEQLEYVMTSIKENVFLKACAGSGKTEVIGLKAAYEMKKWNSYNQGIAVLTFTNDATDVIIDRVKQFTGRNAVYPHYIGTLSSFIHSYIVQPFAYTLTGFEGKDEDFSFNIIDRTVPVYSNSWLNTYKCRVSYLEANNRWSSIFAHQIGYDIEKKDFYFYIGKNKMEWLWEYYLKPAVQAFIKEKRIHNAKFWEMKYLRKCFRECKEVFWKAGFSTFDDLNILAIRLLKRDIGHKIALRFPVIFIDECQDLSGNELRVLKALQEQGCIVHCIGDLNQSIYEFKRVDPDEILKHVGEYKQKELHINFRSCKEIVALSERLINVNEIESANLNNLFGSNSLVYFEYDKPDDAINSYYKILKKFDFLEKENRILVRQNSMKLQLEKSTRDGMDEKEPLIVATQLWKDGTPQQMKIALELAGKQISKWLGNGRTKANYYCPKEISSVFYWRVFLMNVLNKILSSKKLSNFNVTCGKWHEYAKKELGIILEEKYPIIADYDEIKDREFEKMINGKSYRVSNGNKDVVIGEIDEKVKNAIPIMTIHGSKGCTFDTTLVISTKNARSIGGHWKEHWLNGTGEAKRIGYVASTRAKYLLVWGVPKMNSEDKELLKSYGFVNGEDLI